ncbi:PIH1 family, partial [Blyttiomyces helicus]
EDPEMQRLLGEFNRRVAAEQNDPTTAPSEILPEPGYVVKTFTESKVGDWPAGMKVFVNICHSPLIPPPPLVSDEELRRALNAEDNATYKVPLSLSPPRPDRDKSGKTCLVFDACVHTDPVMKAFADGDFRLFLTELALEWVEEKHKLQLSRAITSPKMKSKGALVKHTIRRPLRPYIAEVKPPAAAVPKSAPTTTDPKTVIATLPQEPRYDIIAEPAKGKPEFLVIHIRLPETRTTKSGTLDIEKNRVIFSIPNQYHLDAPLPHPIDTEEAGAQFHRGTRVLTVTAKV